VKTKQYRLRSTDGRYLVSIAANANDIAIDTSIMYDDAIVMTGLSYARSLAGFVNHLRIANGLAPFATEQV
jgi:hypothetical protein